MLKELFNSSNRKDYVLKILEELAELQVALTHYELGKTGKEEVLDEVADVSIQLDKIVVMLENDGFNNPTRRVKQIRRHKLCKIRNINSMGSSSIGNVSDVARLLKQRIERHQ